MYEEDVELKEEHSIQGSIGGIINVIASSIGANKAETRKDIQEISFSIPVVLPSVVR